MCTLARSANQLVASRSFERTGANGKRPPSPKALLTAALAEDRGQLSE